MEIQMKLRLNFFVFLIFGCSLLDFTECQTKPRLEILPVQSIQRKPVGQSLMLTCRSDAPDLVTNIEWKDNYNQKVLEKSAGQAPPPMYTENLPGDRLALIINSLTESMAGNYSCTASYVNTEPLEIGVRIETYVAITWKNALENQFPILGKDYQVRCEVTANPPPTVDWLRNGDSIKTGGRYVVETHGLLIRNVEESDDGIYTCRAAVIQTGELVERNIRVEVQIVPKVDPLPNDLEAIEGNSFAVMCNATGKPVPEISWIKSLSQQNMATADRFQVNAQTGLMTITRVEEEDYGTYVCLAKNAAGTSESRTTLNVLVRPKIYEFLNITVPTGKEGKLVCKASGRPAPEITFRRFGSKEEFVPGPQMTDDRIILEQTIERNGAEATGFLRITKMERSDDGLYECVARNSGDSAYKVGHIAVEYPPSFEHMKGLPPVFSWDQKRANLSCLAEGMPNATIEWRWNDRLIKDLYDRNLEVEGNGPRSSLLVTPLDHRYYTAYRCIARNTLGSAEHLMELRLARVPEPIPQALPSSVTATTITFEIVPPPAEHGMPITAYTAQFMPERDRDWNYAFNRTWSPESQYIVEGLRPEMSYKFRFAARNLVGLGNWGPIKIQSTPKRSAPEEPRTLHTPIEDASEDGNDPIVISPYADHFELRWKIPADNGEPIDYYQIRYCPGNKVNDAWNEIGNLCVHSNVHASETTAYNMNDLKAGTYYRIELSAHNAIGFSTPAVLLLKTARGADIVLRVDEPALSSVAIVGIAVGAIVLLLLIVDLLCCVTVRAGVIATLSRKTKRSPSDLDEETKLGSGSLIKEPPPSPLPLPPPMKLGGTPLTTPQDEREPLQTPTGSMKKNSSVEFDGRVVHSRSGEIIGKNSAV